MDTFHTYYPNTGFQNNLCCMYRLNIKVQKMDTCDKHKKKGL